MRILFVKPNMGLVDGHPYHDRGRMEPLTFAVLAGCTQEHHEWALCDDRFEAVPYGEPWDVVAINVEIYTARRAYEIAARFRGAGAKVVLGGSHVTLIPDEAQQHGDAVVIGDADPIWAGILEDAEAGRLQPRYRACLQPGETLKGLRPRFDLFAGKSYLPVALSQFGRGCCNQCEYCFTGNSYGGTFGNRPPEEVVAELAERKSRFVFFVDDNLVSDREAATRLFKALRPLKLRWTAQASLRFVADPALMDLMLESGCSGVLVGFESLNRENLEAMNKRSNLAYGSYDQVVERIQTAGLMIWAAFLLGYDHETEASIRETLVWALSKKFAFSAFNVLTPYPGTAFYDRMAEEGRLLYGGKWWLHDGYRFGQVTFRPRNMSPERLSELGLEARLGHNTVYQIFRRATERRTNAKDLWSLATYFAYNPLFRDEMLKKHRMELGYRGFEYARSPREDRWTSRLLEPMRQGLFRLTRGPV